MHEKIQELLVKYNNEQCTEEEYVAVKAHLKECDECKKMLMEMKFDISYDPNETTNETEAIHLTEEYSEGDKISAEVQKKIGDNEVDNVESNSEATDDRKQITGQNRVNKKNVDKKKAIKIAVGVIAIVVLLSIGVHGMNRYMVSKVCRDFMEAYDAAFIIPEEYISSGGAVNRVMFNKEKSERIDELHDYCAEVEDESIERMFEILETSLSEQANGETALITEKDDITYVKVNKMSFSSAEVTVRFGTEDNGYSYHIVCERIGFDWYIKSAELSIV